MPGQEDLGCDVPDPAIADIRPDVIRRVLPVVEAGLEGEVLIGVDAVEVEVEQLVDLESGGRRNELAPVDLAEDLSAFPGRLGHGGEAPPGDLVTLSRQRIVADRDLEVPLASLVLIHALRSGRHLSTASLTPLRTLPVLTMFSRGCFRLKRFGLKPL